MNTDAEVVQVAKSHSLSKHVAAHVGQEQRTCMWRRQITQNMLDIDTSMRVEGGRSELHTMLVAACVDYTAPLLSVGHGFLFMAMERSRTLDGANKFVRSLYVLCTFVFEGTRARAPA